MQLIYRTHKVSMFSNTAVVAGPRSQVQISVVSFPKNEGAEPLVNHDCRSLRHRQASGTC